MAGYPAILGVYCHQRNANRGLGGTVKRDQSTVYYYVRQISDEKFELQPLDNRGLPSGICTNIDRQQFLLEYRPEPQYYFHQMPSEMETLINKIDQNKKDFDRNNLNGSEKKLIQSLMIDESYVELDNVQERVTPRNKDYLKLIKILKMLSGTGENFNFEQRQRFNKFGINLRKDGFYDESINYHEKTLEINEFDEHVYFNLARVYFEKGNIKSCIDYLEKALKLNPQFEEAKKFIRYCRK
mgnify:FL=1